MACVGGWEGKARDWAREIWLCLSYFDLKMLLTDKTESVLSEQGFCSAALKILHTCSKSAHSLEDQLAWQTLDILYTILGKQKVFPYKNFLQAKAWHAKGCPGAIKKEFLLSKFSACKSCCSDNICYQRALFNPTSCSRANVSLPLLSQQQQWEGKVGSELFRLIHQKNWLELTGCLIDLKNKNLSSKHFNCLNDFLHFKQWSVGLSEGVKATGSCSQQQPWMQLAVQNAWSGRKWHLLQISCISCTKTELL